ncbi:unnamed protein product [Boreogadus saida]
MLANRKKAEARKTGGGPPLQPSQRLRRWPSDNRVCVLWLRASLGGAPLIPPPTPQDRSAFVRVTDGVIALLEPDALTNLHAIVTIQKMQKDALEIHILEHKLKVSEVQTGILFPALKTYPILMTFFVLSGNKEILIKSRLSLLEHRAVVGQVILLNSLLKGFYFSEQCRRLC